jgi:hypothetical protein
MRWASFAVGSFALGGQAALSLATLLGQLAIAMGLAPLPAAFLRTAALLVILSIRSSPRALQGALDLAQFLPRLLHPGTELFQNGMATRYRRDRRRSQVQPYDSFSGFPDARGGALLYQLGKPPDAALDLAPQDTNILPAAS